jgi:hypothetical protein
MLEKVWVWDPGSGKTLFRIPDPELKGTTGSATLIVIIGRTGGGASFPGPAEDGSVPTPSTVGQTYETPLTDEEHAPATMHAKSTPFNVAGAAAVVGSAAAGVAGAAAAAGLGAATAARIDAAAAARIDAAAAGVAGAAAVAMVGAATAATDGTARDACTPYERRSPVAVLDSTPRGPTHPPPPPGPPPAQSHIAPEIEANTFTHFHSF